MDTCTEQPDRPQSTSQQSLPRDIRQAIRSETLFMASNEVLISHEGEHYRLRRTRNGKLILTK